MKKLFLTSVLVATAASTFAQVSPKVKPDALVSGEKYVLVNKAQTVNQFTSRTSWDGALYFLGEEESQYVQYALTAQKNEDGSWSFSLPTEDGGLNYMVLPEGSANVNVNSASPAKWILDAKADNFYQLIVGEGNNRAAMSAAGNGETCTPTGDVRMHLNAGGQYFCVTYYGGPWFPDCFGGINNTDNEADGSLQFAANDSISFNWGFVKTENIPAYYEDMQYVSLLNNYYSAYCSKEGYEKGFLLTFNKVADLYKNSNDLTPSQLSEILDGKADLCREIENAIALNELDDADLAAAIEAAQKCFDEAAEKEAVENATKALKDAEMTYIRVTGDMTSLGKNMSFEDLSAQGGTQTTGVAGAPYGWNVYVNGKQVKTADEVRGAGIPNWHGVNSDCEGEVKTGNYGFGIWAGNIPEYELSQTIVGLETGTYEITAGLMAGSNGNGSRLTTQRLFGNMNSCYYGCQDDYNTDVLNKSENYTFANNPIIMTDSEMRPVSVRAFVYDGKLTFGIRTNGNFAANNRSESNPSGGDGWFKTDNFRIKNLGYDADDAIAVYKSYADVLENYLNDNVAMAGVMKEKLESILSEQDELTADNSQEEIVEGIKWAVSIFGEVEASVEAYDRLHAAIEKHHDYLMQYESKPGAGIYSDVIMDAEAAYEDGTAEDEAAVEEIINQLEEALEACVKSDAIEEGDDVTYYIQNPSFEDLSAQGGGESSSVANAPKGWNMYIDGVKCSTVGEINEAGINAWCAINNGDDIDVTLEDGTTVNHQYSDGTHLWGIWNATIPEVELSQTISGLPAGTYTLSCDVLIQYNWAGNCLTTQRIFANEYTAMYSSADNYGENIPEDALHSADIDSQNPDATVKHLVYAGYQCEAPRSDYSNTVSLTFGLAEKGDIKIGFRTSNIGYDGTPLDSGKGWFKLDNFRLTYDSAEIPAASEITDIMNVETANTSATEYYSLSGIRMNAPQKGVYIVKKNGRLIKISY